MPSEIPRLHHAVDDLDEEAHLEGPTAVSTPTQHNKSSILDPASDTEKGKCQKAITPSVVGLQEAGPETGSVVTPIDNDNGQDFILVTFNHPYDPDNPYNWSRFKKIRICVLVLTYALVRIIGKYPLTSGDISS